MSCLERCPQFRVVLIEGSTVAQCVLNQYVVYKMLRVNKYRALKSP